MSASFFSKAVGFGKKLFTGEKDPHSSPPQSPSTEDQHAKDVQDSLEGFLQGMPQLASSSNVLGAQYKQDADRLRVQYKSGQWYRYEDVSPSEAASYYGAGSKGGWVWDNLRIRGTQFGHQKPYFKTTGKDVWEHYPSMAGGGYVEHRYGSGRDDEPIFATPGEFIVPRQVAEKIGPLLQAFTGATNKRVGRHFAGGGSVGGGTPGVAVVIPVEVVNTRDIPVHDAINRAGMALGGPTPAGGASAAGGAGFGQGTATGGGGGAGGGFFNFFSGSNQNVGISSAPLFGTTREGALFGQAATRATGSALGAEAGGVAAGAAAAGPLGALLALAPVIQSRIQEVAEMPKRVFLDLVDKGEKFAKVLVSWTDPAARISQWMSMFSTQVGKWNPAGLERFQLALDNVSAAVGRWFEPIIVAASRFADDLNVAFTAVATPIRTFVSTVVDPLRGAFSAVAAGITSFVGAIVEAATPIVRAIMPIFSMLGGMIGAFFQVIATGIRALQPLWNLLGSALGGVISIVLGFGKTIMTVGHFIGSIMGDVASGNLTNLLNPNRWSESQRAVNQIFNPQGEKGPMTFAGQQARQVGIEEIGQQARAAAFSQGFTVQDQQLQEQVQINQNLNIQQRLLAEMVRIMLGGFPLPQF